MKSSSKTNKKILINTRNFPPLVGGMENLLYCCYEVFRKDYSVSLVGPLGCKQFVEENEDVYECRYKPISVFLIINTIKLCLMAVRQRPQVIFSGSGLTALSSLIAGKIINANTVCYLHGVDLVVDSKIYQLIIKPAIRSMDRLIVNSIYTKNLAISSGLNIDKISLIHPTVNQKNSKKTYKLKSKYISKSARPRLLSVGRLHDRKGIAEFVKFCLPILVRSFPEIVYIVVGDDAKDAITKDKQMERIKNFARKYDVNQHIKFTGIISDEELTKMYLNCDLHIFPIKAEKNNPEGFGIVAIEAAHHGLPTIAFSVGGIADSVKDNVSGFLVKSDDYKAFTEKITNYLNGNLNYVTSETCIKYTEQFSMEKFARRLNSVIEGLQ